MKKEIELISNNLSEYTKKYNNFINFCKEKINNKLYFNWNNNNVFIFYRK